MENQSKQKGIFSNLQSRLRKNRLGELLVLDGRLTPTQLKIALSGARENGQQLGEYLVAGELVSRTAIRRTLVEQWMLRFIMTGAAIFISMASMGFAKKANAGQIQDATTRIALSQGSINQIAHHPKLFGSTEKRNSSLKAFTKWTSMFQRFNASLNSNGGGTEIAKFKQDLQALKNLPLHQMATRVNNMMNAKRYISDSSNYGQNDYWATPVEFFKRGGDCEDFAIAKYTALRALGVPENRLRIVVLQDMQKNIPHAVLTVYTDRGPLILDNQIKTAKSADSIKHYKPIFSINQDAWWLHTAPRGNVTVVASAAR